MAKLPDTTEWANGAAKEGIETIKKILADQYNLTIEKIAELAKAETDGLLLRLPCKVGELHEMLNDFIAASSCDDVETYTTGYRNGYRNGRIELLGYILQLPDGTNEQALKDLEDKYNG